MGDPVERLRGQVVHRPKEQVWMLKADADLEEYKYTCESGHTAWTPMNSNLCMQGIKVKENRPIPEQTITNLADSHEDTLLLLDLMRQKRMKEGAQKREAMIRELGLAKKQAKQQISSPHLECQLSWNCKTATSTTGGT